MKETCWIGNFWAYTAHKDPFRSLLSFPGGQWCHSQADGQSTCMGCVSVWTGSHPHAAWKCLHAADQILTPFLLSFDSLLHCPKSTEREFSVNIRTWKPAQVLSRYLREARAHCVHICTSPIMGWNLLALVVLEACKMHKTNSHCLLLREIHCILCVSLKAMVIIPLWQNWRVFCLKRIFNPVGYREDLENIISKTWK